MAFPATYNFNYYKGDTFEFVIYPKTSSGSTFSLDDYDNTTPGNSNKALFTIATSRGSSATQYSASATVDIVEDKITCKILPSVGRQLIAGTTYVYDVQISNGADIIYTLLTGTISVTDDVTGAV